MHPFLGAFAPMYGGQASTNTTPTTVTTTTSGTAYNNITPVQLVASTSQDVTWLTLRCPVALSASGARSSTVFEIMAGGAGSEYTIIGPVSVGGSVAGSSWSFPIFIPQGTRVSIRVRSARLSANLTWTYHFGYATGRDSVGWPQRWVAYGLTDDGSANAQGTIVAPGNATWGSWTSVSASTTYAHDLWLPIIDNGTQTTITAVTFRTRWVVNANTTDAATAATNGTVWHGPWGTTTTAEAIGDAWFGAAGGGVPRNVGGFGNLNGIFYQPAPAGAAISASAYGSAAPAANTLGCSILAAL